MKQLILLLTLSTCINAAAQEAFDGKHWKAPYHLDSLPGWDIERFLLPASFAPGLPWKGVEDIRFMPGWSRKESNEYWSYAFLWYLEGDHRFTSGHISQDLAAYYSGLFAVNTGRSPTDTAVASTVKATAGKIKRQKGDRQTFRATVSMTDYMSKQPIVLNLIIHIKTCKGKDHSFVFHEVSPRPPGDAVWDQLHRLWKNFRCQP